MTQKTKLATIISDPVFRRGFSLLLKEIENIELTWQVFELDGLLQITSSPDIIFVDTGNYVRKGLDIANEIFKRFPYSRIIILTVFEDNLYHKLFQDCGIHGLLKKPVRKDFLGNAIKCISIGGKYFMDREIL